MLTAAVAAPGDPPSNAKAFPMHAEGKPPGDATVYFGIPVGPDLKSSGFPKKSHRIGVFAGGLTGSGPTPAASVPSSIAPQNCGLSIVVMVLISQPSAIWPKPLRPGIA